MEYTFLHRPKPKKFEYQPRFYDAEKEKEKERGYKADETEKFARRLHQHWDSKRYKKHKNGLSPVVIFGMVFVIVLLLYIIFK